MDVRVGPRRKLSADEWSLLQHHSSKASILLALHLTVQLSQPYMTTGKTIALTICTFVSRVMSLLFKTLPRFVIAFLSRSNHLISCRSHHAQRFITQEEEIYHYFHHFLFYLPCSNGARCHDLSFCFVLFFLIFNFKLALSLSFFTLIKRLFSSSSLSA